MMTASAETRLHHVNTGRMNLLTSTRSNRPDPPPGVVTGRDLR